MMSPADKSAPKESSNPPCSGTLKKFSQINADYMLKPERCKNRAKDHIPQLVRQTFEGGVWQSDWPSHVIVTLPHRGQSNREMSDYSTNL